MNAFNRALGIIVVVMMLITALRVGYYVGQLTAADAGGATLGHKPMSPHLPG